jgi:hypothetical protein
MLKRTRATLTSLAVFVIFMTNAGTAAAQTFSDVTRDSWYFDYVEQLVSEGVIATNTKTYRPDDAITRAELVGMIIASADGLAGFEAPAIPTFSDVPAYAGYYDDVEAAARLGIVSGYTDVNGNPTGKFGPSDTVTRAAAVKILINAFSIPQVTETQSVFPDVKKGAWYYPYVISAYSRSIVGGYEDGTFGPDDPVTRAQIAKLIISAKKTVIETVIETGESELKVSLNNYQPPAVTVPLASTATLINLDLTATGSDVRVSSIALTRGGVGNTSDWSGVYLYEGPVKLTSEYSINSESNKVTIPVDLNIEAGKTTTLTAYADSDVGATPSDQHYFSLASAADITSDARQVIGNFPESGNVITIGNAFANTLTIIPGSALSEPIRDQVSEIATFKLIAGDSGRVSFEGIILTQGGTLDSDKMRTCSLLHNSDVIATADQFFNDRLAFSLETPYVIPGGQNRNFSVECYIDGGRSTDTVQLYLDTAYDLLATDINFGFAAAPLNGFEQILAPGINLRHASVIIQY